MYMISSSFLWQKYSDCKKFETTNIILHSSLENTINPNEYINISFRNHFYVSKE